MYGNIIEKGKVYALLKKWAGVCLILIGLFNSVSEAGNRNLVRIIILMTVCCLFVCPSVRDKIRDYRFMLFLWVAYFLLITFSAFRTDGGIAGALNRPEYTLNYTFLLIFAIPLLIDSRKLLERIFLGLLVSMFFNDIAVFWQSYHGVFRPDGLWNYLMDVALVYTILLPCVLILLIENKVCHMWFYKLSFILGIAALILTNTRGAWAGVAVSCLVALFMCRKYINLKKVATLILLLVALLGVFALVKPQEYQRIYSVAQFATEKHPEGERVLIWTAAVQMMEDYPLTGVGMFNFLQYYREYYLSPLSKEGAHSNAHNNFLQIGAENGIAAAILYAAFNIYMLIFAWRRRSSVFGVMMFSMVLAFNILGLTWYFLELYSSMRVFWLSLGLCLTGMQLEKKDKSVI